MMGKAKKGLVWMGALLFAGTVCAQTPDEVNLKFNEAAELINAQKMVEAIPILEEVINMGLDAGADALPTVENAQKLLPQCFLRKGLMAASAKNFDQALEDLSKAEEMAELYGVTAVKNQATAMLSKVYMVDGSQAFNSKDYAKAIKVFSQGYAKNPNDTDLALLLAKSYAESGDMTKAGEIYKNIIALETSHSKYAAPAAKAKEELSTYVLIAAADAAKENNLDKVVEVTDVVLSFDPTNAMAQMLRAQTATNVKNYDAVISYGESVAEAQADAANKSNAYFLLGAAYQNKENKDKAIEIYKKVVAGPNVATAKAQIAALSK